MKSLVSPCFSRVSMCLAWLCVALVQGGCAVYPSNPREQAEFHLANASKLAAEGRLDAAVQDIEVALARSTELGKLADLFRTDNKLQSAFVKFQLTRAERIDGPYDLSARWLVLDRVEAARALPPSIISDLRDKIGVTVAARNLANQIELKIGDAAVDHVPALQRAEQQKVIIDRTLAVVRAGQSQRIPEIVAFARAKGEASPEYRLIRETLETSPISSADLIEVGKLFPDLAAARRAAAIGKAVITVTGGDRLVADDVKQHIIANVRGFRWREPLADDTVLIEVERVRHTEVAMAERTQTVTYSRYEVALVEALLLMPNNSSFLYEWTVGGAEIEYGYVVTVSRGGRKLHEEVVRGKVGGESRSCSNARIQNVFGGTQPAGFTANADMAGRCSGRGRVSMDDLRKQVLDKVVEAVLAAPEVRKVHLLN